MQNMAANSSTSVFPANTNVLYVGLRAAERVVAQVCVGVEVGTAGQGQT